MKEFKIERPWGPPKLRKLFQSVAKAINERTPKKGFGIETSDLADGIRISLSDQPKKEELIDDTNRRSGGGSGGGTASELEGALNGQPVTFHLVETAEPTPRT